jgi:hypothetical protein
MVIVPPDFGAAPLELLVLDPDDELAAPLDDELDEPPHAASANAVATATTAATGRVYFLMRPPPRGLSGENLIDPGDAVGTAATS